MCPGVSLSPAHTNPSAAASNDTELQSVSDVYSLEVTLFAAEDLSHTCSRMRGSKIQATPICMQGGHQ